ncbi:epidermal growth factor receptor kinase substrate 8-like protein 1 [Lates japonicus]|uniref:Epidermal growth factor receptor kinase substrate 8-like protein 1 n=1 Tax=Lates japonicus TaxID=270547 RepID=A0AAD3MW87_LATJO|nr:epidermal growth factor receptor kinase substrate 8-like protein 1 [Lates japonicus]
MYLDVGTEAIQLRDIQSQDELENYTFKSIYRCDAMNTEKHFPSLLMLICQGEDQKKPDIHFFNCETVRAEEICDNIAHAVSDSSSSRSKKVPDSLRLPQSGGEMLDPYDIPSPPIAHAPNPPPPNPPPYPGPRAANAVNGGPDISFLRAEREVGILNHCFDDIENFMGKLQQTAEAVTVLSQKTKKKKKKSKKQSAEEDLLTAKARPPPEEEFIDIFQKFKYCFSLLARLKSAISKPSSEELVHHVFKPLDIMVAATGGPALQACVEPRHSRICCFLLQGSQLRGPIAPYTPVFLDDWKPEALRADGQVWEDPVESQHKYEALQVKQEQQQPPRPPGPPSDETDGSTLPPEAERLYSCSYDFIARNSSELSVQQGETLEVIESSKRWWKCRNRFNQIGIVPFNILEPVAHIDSPVTNRPPSAPAPPPLTKTFSVVPPSPPALPQAPTHSPQRPRSLPACSQHLPAAEDTDKVMMVNDELLKADQWKSQSKQTSGHPKLTSETSVPLDYHSPQRKWLSGSEEKSFSEPAVSCLELLTGAQLFSQQGGLRAVIPDERQSLQSAHSRSTVGGVDCGYSGLGPIDLFYVISNKTVEPASRSLKNNVDAGCKRVSCVGAGVGGENLRQAGSWVGLQKVLVREAGQEPVGMCREGYDTGMYRFQDVEGQADLVEPDSFTSAALG